MVNIKKFICKNFPYILCAIVIAIFVIVVFCFNSIRVSAFDYNNILAANSNSGTAMSTGHEDWQSASDNVSSTKTANYLQIEASWYNEAYDVYRAYLCFDTPDDVTFTSAILNISSKGVIYNEDDIMLMIVDTNTKDVIGSIGLSKFEQNPKESIELDASKLTSGSITIITNNEIDKQAPLGWNWITLDIGTDRPSLTYYCVEKAITEIPTTKDSGVSFTDILFIAILMSVVLGFCIWKTKRRVK